VTADRLYRDPELVQFYDLENGWDADLEYCSRLASGCASVLDLGCGTGQFAATLVERGVRDVVGVDPAQAMLDIAAQRPGGERGQWIAADARTVRLERRFELIVLTGHAFQVFLTDEDRAAALRTIAAHLAPRGRFIFDSRNPADEAWTRWTPERSRRRLVHPSLGPVTAWNDADHDPLAGVVTYNTYYEVIADGRRHTASARIGFPSRAQITALAEVAGLVVHDWMGDWSGSPWEPNAREIICLGGLVPST
jgi:SAM-dependent methyltransferase